MRSLRAILWIAYFDQIQRLRHTLYLGVTVAVTVGAWWVLSAMASPFVTVSHPDKSHYIKIHSSRGEIAQPLPKRYADKLATLPDVQDMYYTDLDTFECNQAGYIVTINAWGGPGVPQVLTQEGFTKAQIHAFQDDPLALLTDDETASRCGWHVGTGISPKGAFSARPMELHIKGIANNKKAGGVAYAHYSYINHMGGVTEEDQVAQIRLHARDPRDNNVLASRIQAMFAHSDPPVEAVPDTINQNAWSRFGEVQYLLALVMAAVFCCSCLVLSSVVTHTTMQRRAQIAVMQVLGFSRVIHWFALIFEVVLILLLGSIIGVCIGTLMIYKLEHTLGSTFQNISAPSWAWVYLWPGLFLLLLSAVSLPSVIISKVIPTDCRELRT